MSKYAFMTEAKFEQIKSELQHGFRYSLDGSQVVAKLADGQEPEGVTIETHAQASQTILGPDWAPPIPEEQEGT
jgi:hypothetical protein